MKKQFLLAICLAALVFPLHAAKKRVDLKLQDDRAYWAGEAYRMSLPVLEHLANERLKAEMPVEVITVTDRDRKPFTHLEAVGRLLCGIAPWFELPEDSIDNPTERALRTKLLGYVRVGLSHAVDPASPDYLNFREPYQPLVDAAFLAQAFLRSPTQLWGSLDSLTQRRMVTEMKATRAIQPWFNNWLMFAATVEAFLVSVGEEPQTERADSAFRQMERWYIGDGQYSDGAMYHIDYYNSFVIQPMLVDAGRIFNTHFPQHPLYTAEAYGRMLARAARYGEVLERSISPEGTFPVVGRSVLYRTGCLQSLSQAALLNLLDTEIEPAQVRGALTAVMRRLLSTPGVYDVNGWMTLGFTGGSDQKEAGEDYLSTGSMYMASAIFLPLGLSPKNPFWAAPAAPWTTQKAWGGAPFSKDKAITQ